MAEIHSFRDKYVEKQILKHLSNIFNKYAEPLIFKIIYSKDENELFLNFQLSIEELTSKFFEEPTEDDFKFKFEDEDVYSDIRIAFEKLVTRVI